MNVVNEKDDGHVNDGDDDDDDEDDAVDENEVANDKCDKHESENVNLSDPRRASAGILRREQRSDRSLIHCWSLADRHKAGYYVRDGVLYRNYKYLGQDYEQLVLPVGRRPEVMGLARGICAGHLGAEGAGGRVELSFAWPTIASDVQKTCESCHRCRRGGRVAVCDRVPVTPIPRGDIPFDSVVMDCIGPLFSNQKVELPLNLGKTASEYLEELKRNLEKAQDYATAHTEKAQQRYVSRYNLRAREKLFEIGQKVLVLIPDSSSSKTFSRWEGPERQTVEPHLFGRY